MFYELTILTTGILTGYIVSHIYELKYIVSDILKHMYIPNSLKKISKSVHELTYVHNGTKYKIMMTISKGPKKYTHVTTSSGGDMSATVLHLMGPNQDFHNHFENLPDTFRELYFHTLDGDILSFDEVKKSIQNK